MKHCLEKLILGILAGLSVGCHVGRAQGETPSAPPGPPPAGLVVYEGRVTAVYPPAGRVKLAVSRVSFPGGLELPLAEPLPALLMLPASGHAEVRSFHGPGRAADLKPEDPLSVSVRYTVDDPKAPGQPVSVRKLAPEAPRGAVIIPASATGSTMALPPVTAELQDRPSQLKWPAMVFPVLGHPRWSDTYGAPRDGGARSHIGQDLAAPKMSPVVAAFDGEVGVSRSPGSCSLSLRGRNGWLAKYMHLNNDRPGTDDGQGSEDFAFAPGLATGDWVVAGQMLGWVGDSGNAEETISHLHFELHTGGSAVNAAPALRRAAHIKRPRLPVVLPEAKAGRGEVRLDGFVRLLDPTRAAMQIDLRSVTDARGRIRIITRPERRWIRLANGVRPELVGDRNTPVDFQTLKKGTPVLAIGASNGHGTFAVRRLIVDRTMFQASPELARAIVVFANGGDTAVVDAS